MSETTKSGLMDVIIIVILMSHWGVHKAIKKCSYMFMSG